MIVQLEREDDDEITAVPTVIAPKYPKAKEEGWWLVVSDGDLALLSIKRVKLKSKSRSKLSFTAPDIAGNHNYKLYLICDSYLGCDQVIDFSLNVAASDNNGSSNMEVEK